MSKLRRLSADRVAFNCPGCGEVHAPSVGEGGWWWNEDMDSPTFTPSILSASGHYAQGWIGPACWCTYEMNHPDTPSPFVCNRCHSFVTDGKIQFLADCTHLLAGQTVEIPEWSTNVG